MITASPSHPRRSRARPRCTRTGDRRRPATPKRSAAMSHASRLEVTASRVNALQLAQIDTVAKPNTAPLQIVRAGWLHHRLNTPRHQLRATEEYPPRRDRLVARDVA